MPSFVRQAGNCSAIAPNNHFCGEKSGLLSVSGFRRLARNSFSSGLPYPSSRIRAHGREREVLETFYRPKARAILDCDVYRSLKRDDLVCRSYQGLARYRCGLSGCYVSEIGIDIDNLRKL